MKSSTGLLAWTAVFLAVRGSVVAHDEGHRPSSVSAYPPTPSTESSITSSVVPRAGGNIKRGIAFNDINLTRNFRSNQVSWAYNWDHSHQGSLPAGVQYFPMLWSADADHTGTWHADATAAIAAGATHLLFVNEPDIRDQANMSPQAAANAWKTYMEPFKGRATLVGPAISNGGPPMGTAWLDQFFIVCSGCSVDAVAMHIYDSATNTAYYKNYITDIGTRYGKPVLVTEFGADGSVEQQQQFMKEILPFLDGLNTVTHYAYFMAAPGILVNADGSLTSLGQTYVST